MRSAGGSARGEGPAGLVFAWWTHDRRVVLCDGGGGLAAGVARVAEQGLTTLPAVAASAAARLDAPARLTARERAHSMRGAVNRQQIIVTPGTLAGEDHHQPLQRVRRPAAAFADEIYELAGRIRRTVDGRHRDHEDADRDVGDALRDPLHHEDATVAAVNQAIALLATTALIGRRQHEAMRRADAPAARRRTSSPVSDSGPLRCCY